MESRLPVGIRFSPTDFELLFYYLKNKVESKLLPCDYAIRETNLYDHSPDDIIQTLNRPRSEKEWYFFTPRDKKYPNGSRPNRRAGRVGFWKASGAAKEIKDCDGNIVIGIKRLLSYYEGTTKTSWLMHEYCLKESSQPTVSAENENMKLDSWVLCKIYKKTSKDEEKGKDGIPHEDTEIAAAAATPIIEVAVETQNIKGMEEMSMLELEILDFKIPDQEDITDNFDYTSVSLPEFRETENDGASLNPGISTDMDFQSTYNPLLQSEFQLPVIFPNFTSMDFRSTHRPAEDNSLHQYGFIHPPYDLGANQFYDDSRLQMLQSLIKSCPDLR